MKIFNQSLKRKGNLAKAIFEEKMANNFPKLRKSINSDIQPLIDTYIWLIPNKINTHQPTSRNIIVNLSKTEGKGDSVKLV